MYGCFYLDQVYYMEIYLSFVPKFQFNFCQVNRKDCSVLNGSEM